MSQAGSRHLVPLLVLALVAACEGGPLLLPSPSPSEAPPTDLGAGSDVSIGVSLPGPGQDPFLATVIAAATARAAELGSVELHLADSEGRSDTQLDQVAAFVDAGVDALLVVPVDADATAPIADVAAAGSVPLVWLTRRPTALPADGSTPFVGSDSLKAGTLEMEALADRLGGRGGVAILMGDPLTESAIVRTEGCKDVVAQYPGLRVTREGVGAGSRVRAHEIVTAWLADETLQLDAVCANDDEQALGAIDALDEAGRLDRVAVGGVDGMADALEAMQAGRLAVTVFQDAAAQGTTAVDTAVARARGRSVPTVEGQILLPGTLVTPDNVGDYLGRNVPPEPTPAPAE
jgi:inositol transport system substrate-binding protein